MHFPEPILYNAHKHHAFLSSFARIHAACIDNGTLAGFLPPLSFAKIEHYWSERLTAAARGEQHIIMQLKHKHGCIHSKDFTYHNSFLVGFVILTKGAASETGPFRGGVQRLLVDPEYWRLGVATRLMKKLDEVAVAHGRLLLQLDTVSGTPAEHLYKSLGWTKVGVIKNYAIHPQTHKLKDNTFYYKDLRYRDLRSKARTSPQASPSGSRAGSRAGSPTGSRAASRAGSRSVSPAGSRSHSRAGSRSASPRGGSPCRGSPRGGSPTRKPIGSPSVKPGGSPTSRPATSPSSKPLGSPALKATTSPSLKPVEIPASKQVTCAACSKPMGVAITRPTANPTSKPTRSDSVSRPRNGSVSATHKAAQT